MGRSGGDVSTYRWAVCPRIDWQPRAQAPKLFLTIDDALLFLASETDQTPYAGTPKGRAGKRGRSIVDAGALRHSRKMTRLR